MNAGKSLSVVLALGLALMLGACGAQPQGTEAAEAATSAANLTKIDFDGTDKPATVNISVAEGKSLVVMGNLSAGEAAIKTYKGGEWLSDDYLYEGYAVSSSETSGDYEITFEPKGAKGVVYVIEYDTTGIDYENKDGEQLFNEILADVG